MNSFTLIRKAFAILIAALVPATSTIGTAAKLPANTAKTSSIIQYAEKKQTINSKYEINLNDLFAPITKINSEKQNAAKVSAANKAVNNPIVINPFTPEPEEVEDTQEYAPEEDAAYENEEASAAQEEAPAAQEEAPAAQEETPAAQEEAPVAQEEATAAEETDAAAPEKEAKEETQAAPVTENTENNIEAVETWDISNSENDNVKMSYYDSNDIEAILDSITGSIKSLFTPMTAYAADVTIIRNDAAATSIDDDDDELDTTPQYTEGTVVISGEGEMEDGVYNYFTSTNSYINACETALYNYYHVTVEGEYDESITDVLQLDANVVWRVTEGNDTYPTGSVVYITEEIRNELNAGAFLDYSPMTIVFVGNVTNISDYAFLLCAGLEEVILPDSVKSIGDWAFAYCTGLKTLRLDSELETIGESAFYQCRSLDTICIPGSVYEIGYEAFKGVASDAYIYVENEDIWRRLGGPDRRWYISDTTEIILVDDINEVYEYLEAEEAGLTEEA